MRLVRIVGLALGIGLFASSWAAEREPVPLSQVKIEGVRVVDGVLKIDPLVWSPSTNEDGVVVLAKKGKKGGKKPDSGTVGIACSCEGGRCSITLIGNEARCSGDACCGFVKIWGEPLVVEPL